MLQTLHVYTLPEQVTLEGLAGGTVVVIDVLRASTTIVHALEAGAAEVIPCLEVEEAVARAAEFPEGRAILGGEREGLPIDGFALGNSPDEYTADRVEGRVVVFTTTNGTRAMSRCRLADRVLIGAFVNASAVYQRLLPAEKVHLLCAGSRGECSSDDALLAGLLVDRLLRKGGRACRLNRQAQVVREQWGAAFAVPFVVGAEPLEPDRLARALDQSVAGRRLRAIGRGDDVRTAAQVDRFAGVPELDPETFRIRLT
jgi:2-phosphosulfolactate phosphatase